MASEQKASRSEEIPQFQIEATLTQYATCTLYDTTLADGTAAFLLQLLPAKSENAVLTNEFLQRVSILSQIDHPNIAPVLASELTEDQHAFALLPKQTDNTIASQLDELTNNTAVSQIQFAHQIASALAIVHDENLIHHHLAPANIYLTETGAPYLVDLAVPVVPTTSLKSKTPITQLDYRPPEQREGKPLTPAANIYSLGVILYTLLAGEAPYLPESDWEIFDYREIPREVPLEQVRTDLTEETYTLVQTCIWQREWNRYQTMAEVITAMDTAVSAEKRGKAKPTIHIPIVPETAQRNLPVNRIALAAILFVILCIGGFFIGRSLFANDIDPEIVPPVEPTATETASQTPALLATDTPIPTNTPSPTEPSATSTPTKTMTPTVTNTSPPTATETETNTATETPTEAIACDPTPPFGWVRYTIQANDTLSGLATRGNTTIERIQEVNCLEGNILSIGHVFWLPAAVLPTDTPTPTSTPADSPSGGGNSSGGGGSSPNPTSPPKATIPPPPSPQP